MSNFKFFNNFDQCNEKNILQVVFEGVWGNSRVSGYMAVDDVTFFEGACTSKYQITNLYRYKYFVGSLFSLLLNNGLSKVEPPALNHFFIVHPFKFLGVVRP